MGEQGKGIKLTNPEEIEENKKLWKLWGFSTIVSDKISVNRSIPDFRHRDCHEKKYLKNLPKVSIVIIFVDEYFSVFKRTLHSLYNRTPHELIEEVILVNDCSTKDFLYEPLNQYIANNFPNIKFEIINLEKRHGLMQARIIGAKAAKSEFLFITEPHCEMTYNWLPPLLEPLINDLKVVTVPIVDNVEYDQLNYYENDRGNKGSRGVFDWDLGYNKLKRFPIEDKDKELDPFSIPIMTGGIYMIRKSYFFEIGPYDPKLVIWGGENIEMSLKIHLCGGKLLEVPCSHIGHYFRAFTKARHHENGMDFEHFNKKRILEVWFDDYKEFVYKRKRELYDKIDPGDLSEAKEFKEKLKCNPFNYFLTDIAPDLLRSFPFSRIPFATGQIQLIGTKYCLETKDEKDSEIKLQKCSILSKKEQSFELSWSRDIRLIGTNMCIDANKLHTYPCHGHGGNQFFKYDIKTKQIIHMVHHQCIESDLFKKVIKLSNCNEALKEQKWTFSAFVNETALLNWKKFGRLLEDDENYE